MFVLERAWLLAARAREGAADLERRAARAAERLWALPPPPGVRWRTF